MKSKLISCWLAIALMVSPTSAQAYEWPDPLVELISVTADTSTYFTDSKIRFNVSINRINNSTYSDITRVWVCPKTTWDGLICQGGQFLVSTTPNTTDTNIVVESPVMTLADGDYVITAVSFRNGAVITGYTLMYPRAGVVTIGGIATTIPLNNLATGDFNLTTPEPEPTPVTEPEPEQTPEPEPEQTPKPEFTPDPEVIEDPQSTATDETEVNSDDTSNEDTSNADPSSTQTETTSENNSVVDDANMQSQEPENNEAVIESPDSTNSEQSQDVSSTNQSESAPINSDVQPEVVIQPESTNSQSHPSQPALELIVIPAIITEPIVEAVVVESTTQLQPNLPTMPLSQLKTLKLKKAFGGKALQVSGNANLVRKIPAGAGKLFLLATNNSSLRLKLGKAIIAEVLLNKKQVISWRANRSAKLKLILSGEKPLLLIDSLQLNEKLIPNPAFQMRR